MTLRKTVLFALLSIMLGAYIFLFERKKNDESSGERLITFEEETVQSLTLDYPDRRIELRRDPAGAWKITHPMEVPADGGTVRQVLLSLQNAEVNRIVEHDPTREDLRNFGLERPRVRISIGTAQGGSPSRILLGDMTPLGHSVYVMREGNPRVLLSSGTLSSSLGMTLKELREKKILTHPVEAIHRISMEGGKGNLVLVRSSDKWFIEKPRPLPADTLEMRDLLSTLSRLAAVDFASEVPRNLELYGLKQPRLRIALYSEDRQLLDEVLFGAKREGKAEVFLAKNPPRTVYTIYESVLQELDKDWSALRNRNVFSFSSEEISRLRIESPEASTVLVKGAGNSWELYAPRKGPARKGTVEDYLTTLMHLRAVDFGDTDGRKSPRSYGFDRPRLKVTLESRDGKGTTLLVGAETGKHYYAKRADSPEVYVVDRFSFQHLSKQVGDFAERQSEPIS